MTSATLIASGSAPPLAITTPSSSPPIVIVVLEPHGDLDLRHQARQRAQVVLHEALQDAAAQVRQRRVEHLEMDELHGRPQPPLLDPEVDEAAAQLDRRAACRA